MTDYYSFEIEKYQTREKNLEHLINNTLYSSSEKKKKKLHDK
jgi:hypothetical protein